MLATDPTPKPGWFQGQPGLRWVMAFWCQRRDPPKGNWEDVRPLAEPVEGRGTPLLWLSCEHSCFVSDCPQCQIAASINGGLDIFTLTNKVVSCLSTRRKDIVAHEALAVRMAFLVRFEPMHCRVCSFDMPPSGRCILKTPAPNSGSQLTINSRKYERGVRKLMQSVSPSTSFYCAPGVALLTRTIGH